MIIYGKIDIAKFLITNLKFDLNLQNNYGYTSLHLSVFNTILNYDDIRFFDFLVFLLEYRANPFIEDYQKNTPSKYLETTYI